MPTERIDLRFDATISIEFSLNPSSLCRSLQPLQLVHLACRNAYITTADVLAMENAADPRRPRVVKTRSVPTLPTHDCVTPDRFPRFTAAELDASRSARSSTSARCVASSFSTAWMILCTSFSVSNGGTGGGQFLMDWRFPWESLGLFDSRRGYLGSSVKL
jgi:hypothetical protein